MSKKSHLLVSSLSEHTAQSDSGFEKSVAVHVFLFLFC